jgi:hypothetical protein
MLTLRVDPAAVQRAQNEGLTLKVSFYPHHTILQLWRLDTLKGMVRVEHTTLEAFGVEISNGLLSLGESC